MADKVFNLWYGCTAVSVGLLIAFPAAALVGAVSLWLWLIVPAVAVWLAVTLWLAWLWRSPKRATVAGPYADYLSSEAWQIRRRAALERAGHRCQVCNAGKRLEVHHRTYERVGAELDNDLTVLCRDCHARFHGVVA